MKDEIDNSTPWDETASMWNSAAGYLVLNGETEPLARMLESESPIPAHVRFILTEHLRGKIKKPDMRGKHNSSLTFEQREEIRRAMFYLYHNTEFVLIHIFDVADKLAKEPQEIRDFINFTRRRIIKSIANKYGLAVNTLRQMYSLEEFAGWSKFFAGEIDLDVADTGRTYSFTEDHGGPLNRDDMKTRALAEAIMYMKHPEVFFDPLRSIEETT